MAPRLFPALVCLAFAWSGCLGPETPASRANDAARDLNVNSRFGDATSVVDLTSPAIREQYLSRRAEWGKMVRVVDVELASFKLVDVDHATVLVDFSWTRLDDDMLHATRVLQEWSAVDGPWLLTREKRASGDIGLFGEPIARAAQGPRPDVQFATRVIP